MPTLTDPAKTLGRSPEALSLPERLAFTGYYVAMETYSPRTLPERVIRAIGATLPECLGMLGASGLDVRKFEVTRLRPPY